MIEYYKVKLNLTDPQTPGGTIFAGRFWEINVKYPTIPNIREAAINDPNLNPDDLKNVLLALDTHGKSITDPPRLGNPVGTAWTMPITFPTYPKCWTSPGGVMTISKITVHDNQELRDFANVTLLKIEQDDKDVVILHFANGRKLGIAANVLAGEPYISTTELASQWVDMREKAQAEANKVFSCLWLFFSDNNYWISNTPVAGAEFIQPRTMKQMTRQL